MIILEPDTPKSASDTEASASTRLNREPGAAASLPVFFESGLYPMPPPYISYQDSSPPPTPLTPLLSRRKSLLHKRRRRQRRILVFISVILNGFLFILLLHAIRATEDDHTTIHHPENSEPHGHERPIVPVTPDAHIGQCIQPASWSNSTRLPPNAEFVYESTARFRFPDPTTLMFLVSQGAHASGRFEAIASSDDHPHIILTARFHSSEVRNRANVCWMERKTSAVHGTGLGIFTPAPFDRQQANDKLEFDITLYLPTTPRGSLLPVYNLETRLPSFTHTLNALRNVIEFDHLHLESKNQPILGDLFARNATLITSNAPIEGKFDASTHLSLITSNAPIDATVNLHSINIFQTTELVVQTRNAPLEAVINLFTSAASGEGGKFNISTHTSDAPLVVSFPTSPAHSTLFFNGVTSNSPANIWLNHAFEGDFALVSNMVFVDRRPFLDPQRLRSVLYGDLKNGMVLGTVTWKLPIFKSKTLGSVKVTTSNHILKLFV